jgi:DNA polymerase (family 10)
MPVHNIEIAEIFFQLADLLEIEGANRYRVRAYRSAARIVRGYPENMVDLVNQGENLSQLPNIGADLADKIKTIVETGQLPLLEEVKSRTPVALSDLMKIQGLGPKRIKTLYHELDIQNPDDLQRAAHRGEIRTLSGFGEKSEQKIKERLERFTGEEQRIKLSDVEEFVGPLVEYLKTCKGVRNIAVAGSYRRRKATVGDLDILITAGKHSRIMADFIDYDEVEEVVSQGESRSTVRLRSGLSVDLRIVPQVCYGAALHYFTGSRAHNIAVRQLAVKKGYKINEYGVFQDEERIAGRTEEEVYNCVDLPYIPPELRENRGELEAARKNRLPKLINPEEIRGDLHCHTDASDGRHTLKQMARAAAERGYEYLSISDHSKQVTVAHGLDEKRLLAQIKAIDELNSKLDQIVVLKSIEVDILEDGSLDLPDSILKELDLTVCSVHDLLNLSSEKQTERILRAMDNPYFNILGHPTGRQINQRAPYALDLQRILEAARDRGCYVELNAHPQRLDLNDEACKMARDLGVLLAISTDAHSTADLCYMRFGVEQARRGWLEAGDVINTQPLATLRKLLKRK